MKLHHMTAWRKGSSLTTHRTALGSLTAAAAPVVHHSWPASSHSIVQDRTRGGKGEKKVAILFGLRNLYLSDLSDLDGWCWVERSGGHNTSSLPISSDLDLATESLQFLSKLGFLCYIWYLSVKGNSLKHDIAWLHMLMLMLILNC